MTETPSLVHSRSPTSQGRDSTAFLDTDSAWAPLCGQSFPFCWLGCLHLQVWCRPSFCHRAPQRRHRQHLPYSPFPAGSWRQLSAPPLSLLSFMLTTGVPSACPCTPCALAPHSLQCRQLGPLHTHQDLSSMRETRTGCQSPGAVAKKLHQRREESVFTVPCLFVLWLLLQYLYFFLIFIRIVLPVCCPVLGRTGNQAS